MAHGPPPLGGRAGSTREEATALASVSAGGCQNPRLLAPHLQAPASLSPALFAAPGDQSQPALAALSPQSLLPLGAPLVAETLSDQSLAFHASPTLPPQFPASFPEPARFFPCATSPVCCPPGDPQPLGYLPGDAPGVYTPGTSGVCVTAPGGGPAVCASGALVPLQAEAPSGSASRSLSACPPQFFLFPAPESVVTTLPHAAASQHAGVLPAGTGVCTPVPAAQFAAGESPSFAPGFAAPADRGFRPSRRDGDADGRAGGGEHAAAFVKSPAFEDALRGSEAVAPLERNGSPCDRVENAERRRRNAGPAAASDAPRPRLVGHTVTAFPLLRKERVCCPARSSPPASDRCREEFGGASQRTLESLARKLYRRVFLLGGVELPDQVTRAAANELRDGAGPEVYLQLIEEAGPALSICPDVFVGFAPSDAAAATATALEAHHAASSSSPSSFSPRARHPLCCGAAFESLLRREHAQLSRCPPHEWIWRRLSPRRLPPSACSASGRRCVQPGARSDGDRGEAVDGENVSAATFEAPEGGGEARRGSRKAGLPGGRFFHACAGVTVGEDGAAVALFGGKREGGELADNQLYLLDVSEVLCPLVAPCGLPGASSARDSASSTSCPPSSSLSSCLPSPSCPVCAGRSLPYDESRCCSSCLSSVSVALSEELRWAAPDFVGTLPSPRYGHSLVYAEPHLILFGGVDGDGRLLGDTWIVNLFPPATVAASPVSPPRLFWVRLDFPSPSLPSSPSLQPLPRCFHQACCLRLASGAESREDVFADRSEERGVSSVAEQRKAGPISMVLAGGFTQQILPRPRLYVLRSNAERTHWSWAIAPVRVKSSFDQRYLHAAVTVESTLFLLGGLRTGDRESSLASLVTYSTLTRRSLAFPHVLLAEAGSQAQQFAPGTFGLQAWEVAGEIFAVGGLRVGGDASTAFSSWRHAESADDSSSCSSLEEECLKSAATRIRDATQSRHIQAPSLIRIDACDYLSSYEADLQRLQRLRLLHAEAGANVAVPELYDLSPHESSEEEENAGDEDRQSWRLFREEDTEDETDSPRAPRLSSEAGKACVSLGVCTPHGAVGDTGRGSGDVTPVSRSPHGVSCGKGESSGPSFGGDGSPWASSAGRLSSASALSSPSVSPESCARLTGFRSPAAPRDGDGRARGESPVSSPRAPRGAAEGGLHAELTEEHMQVDPAASLREPPSTPSRRSSGARGWEGLVSSLSQSRSSPESPRCVRSARGDRDSGVSAPSSPASSRSGASAGAPGWSPRHAHSPPPTGRDRGDSGDRRSVGSSWTGSPTPRSPARGNAHVFSDQAVSPAFVPPPPRPPRPRRAAAQQALDSFRSLPDRPDRRGGNGDTPQSPTPEGPGQGQAEGGAEGLVRGELGVHQAKKPRVDTQAACEEAE
ncbi:UNVERIFIED_CONTAM: hypothetical protein HHA_203480 [Hammondia hammondi]|eukprot:XP_008884632.1 hypothetical protein HHA_203480 [Hammondia hammondi]